MQMEIRKRRGFFTCRSPLRVVPSLLQRLPVATETALFLDPFRNRDKMHRVFPSWERIGTTLYRYAPRTQWTADDLDTMKMWVSEFRLAVWFVVTPNADLLNVLEAAYPEHSRVESLGPLLPWHTELELVELIQTLESHGKGITCISFAGEESYVVVVRT